MTNGEKIIQAFPDLQIDMGELEVYMWTTAHDAIDIPLEWWNAEYKEPNYSEIPTGSITKNCRTCRNFGSHHGICEICKDNRCWTEKEPTIKNDVPENNVGNIYICSCGYGWDKSKVVRHHFCPNCGKAVASATKNDLGVDCISREQAIKQCGFGMTSLLIADNLRKLPPVAPQPIKGHWISHREHCENLGVMPSGLGAYEWCSNCDCGIDVREWHRNHYNYCPNCGADMGEIEV